jgi:hypothetical protein
MYDAFDAGEDLSTERVLGAIRDIVPLAVTMKENIDTMREWAKTRARVASLSGPVARAKAAASAAMAAGQSPSPSSGGFRKLEI